MENGEKMKADIKKLGEKANKIEIKAQLPADETKKPGRKPRQKKS